MPYLVGQRQLRHFRRHSAVVIDESDDPGVQGSLGGLVHPTDRLRIRFVSLANATGCARCGCYPGKTKSTAGKISVNNTAGGESVFRVCRVSYVYFKRRHSFFCVPVGEHVREAEILVVAERMQI